MSCIPVPDYWSLPNIENWEISSSETLTGRTVSYSSPLYPFNQWLIIWLAIFRPVSFTCQGIFRTFCKPCNRNVCWTCCKLLSLVKSNFDWYIHWTILLLYSTRQNVKSRHLSFFRSFCRLLRNVVTETFAEPAANWEVSSNRISIGTVSRPSCPFRCDSWCDVRFPTCQFYRSKSGIRRPSNFRKFLQTAEECCNRNICRTFCKLGSLVKSNFDR